MFYLANRLAGASPILGPLLKPQVASVHCRGYRDERERGFSQDVAGAQPSSRRRGWGRAGKVGRSPAPTSPVAAAPHLTASFAAVAVSAVKQSCRRRRRWGKGWEALQSRRGWAGVSGRCRLGLGCPRRASPSTVGTSSPPAVGAGPRVSALREGAPRGQSPGTPGWTSTRAVLPTLLGVSASKILGVGRIPFWGAIQTLVGPGLGSGVGAGRESLVGICGGPGGGLGEPGRRCGPCVHRRGGPGGTAGWAALHFRGVAEAGVSAGRTARPCAVGVPWAAELLRLYREGVIEPTVPFLFWCFPPGFNFQFIWRVFTEALSLCA